MRKNLLALHVSLLLGSAVPAIAFAQSATNNAAQDAKVDSGTATASATTLDKVIVSGNSVDTLAPSAAPLEASQPTSIIDERFIRDSLRNNSNFDSLIKYAPSMSVSSPEGPGMGKAENTSLRGFQDGQFNMTFDGIPFGDSSDWHHTTSAYFTNHVLSQAQIERGPGTASTIGNATFGGNIGLRSRNPSDVDGITPYFTVGSWNTLAGGVSADEHVGNTAVFADLSDEKSDTYLKNTDDKRQHVFVKTITRLGDETTLTVLANYNKERQNTVQGATKEMIENDPRSGGLTDNPALLSYAGYNGAKYSSVFSYIGLDTRFGDNWSFNDKLYFNNFDHWSNKTADATDSDPDSPSLGVQYYYPVGSTDGTPGDKSQKIAGDVGGNQSDNKFHAIGDTAKFSYDFDTVGSLLFGVWYEHSEASKSKRPMDYTLGVPSYVKKTGVVSTLETYTTDTLQPYLEFDWKLTDQLTLTPGVRYASTKREDKQPSLAYDGSATYSATLPSVSLHDAISDHWSAYAQAAQGFLAPPIDYVEDTDTTSGRHLDPEKTTNFQIGTAYAAKSVTFGIDVYDIDFDNYITSYTPVGSDDAIYVNRGGATYKGAEAEATLSLTHGLSLYANASYNQAEYKHSNVQIGNTPKETGAIGLLYSGDSGFFGSLMDKIIGEEYGDDGSTADVPVFQDQPNTHMGGYSTWDGAFGYRSKDGGPTGKGWTVSLDVTNLFDVHKLADWEGLNTAGTEDTWFATPGRGVFLDFAMKL